MAMYGGSPKNCSSIHQHDGIPIPVNIQLSCGATADSPAAAAATTSSDGTGGGGEHRINFNDQPEEFLMYIYKVKRCSKTGSHDWTECPYAHPGEKARRRDPSKYPYSGVACPEFRRRGQCQQGQNCGYAHGVFEFWLHPTRYRTRVCEAGDACTRRICFFAHTPGQLRPGVICDCFRCGIGCCAAKPSRRKMPAVGAAVAYPSSFQAGTNGANGNGLVGGGGEWFDYPDLEWVEDLLTE